MIKKITKFRNLSMTRLQTILAIIISLTVITGSVWRFDVCKASKGEVIELKEDLATFKLSEYRKELVMRIWRIEKEFPKTYQNRIDWLELQEELKLLDLKIKAYYNKKG
jgi:hypothetical protein